VTGSTPSVAAEWVPQRTLPGRAYWDPAVWDLEQERIFGAGWICVGREEEVPTPGGSIERGLGADQVLVARADDGALHASLERPIALETWNGFLFVNAAAAPAPLRDELAGSMDGDPTSAVARWGIGGLRIGHRITYEVEANWKLVMENYSECLHCPGIHPELVKLVPLFRTGMVEDGDGAELAAGAFGFTRTGATSRPPLPGLTERDLHAYTGHSLFPTTMINLHADCVMSYRLEPEGPTHTTIVSEFLFHPDTIARADFDPGDVAEMWDLVSRQDWTVCERAQLGVRSRAYADGGVYPYNDHSVARFNDRYRAAMAT
jgi:Rieske 2Fe-2S family protein